MEKITFLDGSYIEKNEAGMLYVGVTANDFGHIIRKNKISFEEFALAYKNVELKRVSK